MSDVWQLSPLFNSHFIFMFTVLVFEFSEECRPHLVT